MIVRHTYTIKSIGCLLVAGLALLAGAGCAVHTAAPVAAVHQTALVGWDAGAFSAEAYDPLWWRQLDDPVLEQLEDAALAANHDVRSAMARLDEARAVFDEDRRALYPKVTVGASADLRDEVLPGFTDKPLRINTYTAAFDA